MKYVLLFGDTKERAKQWEGMPAAQREAAYAPINQWFGKYGSKITGGHELQPEPEQLSAMTVALGKRDVFDRIGFGDRDAIPVSSGLSQRLTA